MPSKKIQRSSKSKSNRKGKNLSKKQNGGSKKSGSKTKRRSQKGSGNEEEKKKKKSFLTQLRHSKIWGNSPERRERKFWQNADKKTAERVERRRKKEEEEEEQRKQNESNPIHQEKKAEKQRYKGIQKKMATCIRKTYGIDEIHNFIETKDFNNVKIECEGKDLYLYRTYDEYEKKIFSPSYIKTLYGSYTPFNKDGGNEGEVIKLAIYDYTSLDSRDPQDPDDYDNPGRDLDMYKD